MRLAARNESQAAEAEWEAKSAGGKEWEAEFLFFYRCLTSLIYIQKTYIYRYKSKIMVTRLILDIFSLQILTQDEGMADA